MTELSVSRIDEPGRTVLELSGDLDMGSVALLSSALQQALDGSAAAVVIDLDGLEFCDSSGLNTFVRYHHLSANDGTKLVLRSPGPAVDRLLDVTRLRDLLAFEE